MGNYLLYKGKDEEKRKLSIVNAQLQRHLVTLRMRREEAEDKAKEWQKKYEEEQKENQKLREEIEKIKKQRDTYRDMVFKANRKKEDHEEQSSFFESQPTRKPGGQLGHKGYGRKNPSRIDRKLHIFATCCPHCNGKLNRAKTIVSHTVEDIPTPAQQQTIITRYEIEKQWCKQCKKEIVVTPTGVIPGSRLGLNLLMQVLIWKYFCRIPLNIIVTLLAITYDVHISTGTLVLFLKRTSQYFGKPYRQILKEVRAAPVKHADETGWRVNGENNWCWAFLKEDAVYYTIEETRGKGVPEKILKNCHSEDVLVRDDYAGYKKLPFIHQSCWAHLLRESHKEVTQKESSEEMKELHKKVKTLYEKLATTVATPFVLGERQKIYELLLQQIQTISETVYTADDAKRVHYRIAAQNKNLLTALLYENVPLTNNVAERAIRPMVVTRKISGGSRSRQGATTHAINMSVLQTMKMKNQPIFPTLQKYLLNALSNN
ncbi:MAG TPA: IS66 family transposase [Candidatus Sulfotelmatobacter sp.]|jgi:transposase|nr:IS66 family transposase [Candidatus Sulfotelmatobacter sp.]